MRFSMEQEFSFIRMFFTKGNKSFVALIIYLLFLVFSKFGCNIFERILIRKRITKKDVDTKNIKDLTTYINPWEREVVCSSFKNIFIAESSKILFSFILVNFLALIIGPFHLVFKHKKAKIQNSALFIFQCVSMAFAASIYTHLLLIVWYAVTLIAKIFIFKKLKTKNSSRNNIYSYNLKALDDFSIPLVIIISELISYAGCSSFLVSPIANFSATLIKTYSQMLKI